jgi:hypothetical protein
MTTADQIAQLILLWSLVQDVQLSTEEDDIVWRFTSLGAYTSKSAYEAQFVGSFNTYNSLAIWKAKVEGKHRFFTWLMIQSKLLTADNLLIRGWPCNPCCLLCDQHPETAEHLCLHCSFAQEVWFLVSNWTEGLVPVPSLAMGMEQWWNSAIQVSPREHRRHLASVMIYTAWNIWNERNRRTFEGARVTPSRVLLLIQEEMRLRGLARGGGNCPFSSDLACLFMFILLCES